LGSGIARSGFAKGSGQAWSAWLWVAAFSLLAGWVAGPAHGQPRELAGRLYRAEPGRVFDGPGELAPREGLQPVDALARTGGRFLYQANIDIPAAGTWVIDFKNSSIIAHFEHHLFDLQGRRIAHAAGGLTSPVRGPFLLRHGRDFQLEAGRYRLVTLLDSPSFLAQPRPYLDTLQNYRQAVKWSNALALAGLGVFLGLGVCYGAMALAQRRLAYGMYALFIGGNLWFNAASLLAISDLIGPHPFYLVGLPILFSNLAYIVFVMSLLSIRPAGHPYLWRVGVTAVVLLVLLAVMALLQPAWMLELDRAGVAVFMAYGLGTGLVRAGQGDASARRYLVANLAFFVPALAAISMLDIEGIYTIYIEHIGLTAVAIEVLLLSLVLSYQLGQLQRAHSAALAHADESLRIAHTDELTGVPNRFALNAALSSLPPQGSLTFVDLDGLKHYNDAFGHDRGDELLQRFAQHWREVLGERGTVHRLGGDEFAVTCPDGDAGHVEATLGLVIQHLHASGFALAGASHGTAWMHERGEPSRLKQLADVRMYEHKRARRASARAAVADSGRTPAPSG
jgi:diguanylate cyclase (GGDEF)-like protein